jgi:1,4-alpha-glucan branching enzyme
MIVAPPTHPAGRQPDVRNWQLTASSTHALGTFLTKAIDTPAGYLAFTLHAHLAYVVNHGTWPHGMEWLHEAAAETYLPLLRMLGNLERDGIPANFNINLSPILLEQLAHPFFIAEFPKYLTRKILAAREDEAYFIQSGDAHLTETARFWGRFFSAALDDFNALGGNIIDGFRHFNDAGLIEIITCAATHGYLPLLGTDESVRAQVRTAVNTHIRHLGKPPRGIWTPECGYRPAGFWEYPVPPAGATEAGPGFDRIGIEQALSESGLDYFFVDSHLIEECYRVPSPYGAPNSRLPRDPQLEQATHAPQRSLYQTYYVDGPYDKCYAATVFPRDPSTGLQVWSGDTGYPGDANYLDFHKKRFPGGHRYWQVTGPRVDIGDKLLYWPHQASERVKEHANHFVHLVRETLESGFNCAIPPVLCAPFDAELFGHWWFEGPMWLEQVCRNLHQPGSGIATITCSQYLDRHPRTSFIAIQEGSWGAEGNHQVWMNPETSWTYSHIYPAEVEVRDICTQGKWRHSTLGRRIVQQLCRELMLLESSDWQFLITTGAARDYAESRFLTHNDQFLELKAIWQAFEHDARINEHMTARLAAIEQRDNIFLDIDPSLWAAGASETRGDAGSAPSQPAAI